MDKPDPKHKNTICIYCLTNQQNNKKYIGKTKSLYKRIYQYFYDFKNQRNDHINDYLLNSFNKYGLDNFTWSILESFVKLDEDKLTNKELYYIDKYKTTDKSNGYNLRRDSSSKMIVHHKTSKKISKRLKKEWKNGLRDHHSEKLSKWWKNHPEEKKKQSKIMRSNLTKWIYKIWENDKYIGKFLYSELDNIKDIIPSSVCGAFYQKESNPVDYKQYKIKRIKYKI